MKDYWKFRGRGGYQKPKFLTESMKLNWNFRSDLGREGREGGRGVSKPKHLQRGLGGECMDISWNNKLSMGALKHKHAVYLACNLCVQCKFCDVNFVLTSLYSYSQSVETPHRHVRTRLYFTSESHVHTVLNVFRYGKLFEVSYCLYTT